MTSLERVEHGDAALGGFVEVLAHAVFEHALVDPRVGLETPMRSAKRFEALGGEAAAAGADQVAGGVVPAGDVFSFDQLDQLAFGEHHVGQVEARELDLRGTGR